MSPVPHACSQIPHPDYTCLQILYLGLCRSHEPSHIAPQDFRELLAILQKLPLKCSNPEEDEGPRKSCWAWAALGRAVRREQGLEALAEPRGDRPSTSIPEPCIYGVFSPVPVPPWISVAPLAVGRDLPARQALSMETQMPVSRARSTTEARSPLRWGTMEAVEAKQWGESDPCSGFTLGWGQIGTCPQSRADSATYCPAQPNSCCPEDVVIPASTQRIICPS